MIFIQSMSILADRSLTTVCKKITHTMGFMMEIVYECDYWPCLRLGSTNFILIYIISTTPTTNLLFFRMAFRICMVTFRALIVSHMKTRKLCGRKSYFRNRLFKKFDFINLLIWDCRLSVWFSIYRYFF